MRGKTSVLGVLAAAAIIATNVVPAFADEPPPPIVGEALTARAVFPDDIELKLKLKTPGGATIVVNVDDPSRTAVVRYTIQPGARFPWHTHAGPVIVNVVSGALTYIDSDGCGEETYTAGQAFIDAGHGHVHSAYNPTGSPTILIATFLEAPASGALLIPVDPVTC